MRLLALLRCLQMLASAAMATGWRWQSGFAPLRMAPCRNGSHTQQFRQAANGTIISPSRSKVGPGYCLAVFPANNGSTLSGATVVAADCGDPRFGRQLWREPRGGALMPRDQRSSSSEPLCFGVLPNANASSAEGSEGILLLNCSSAATEFNFEWLASGSPTGAIVQRTSGLCVTVNHCAAPPPAPEPGPLLRARLANAGAPCDIFEADGTPCVAAHSTTRALFANYTGPLYSVTRSSDNVSRSIPLLAPGGYANASVQDAFCAGAECVISRLFDQSSHGNDLVVFKYDTRRDRAANASADRHSVGGHAVYSLYIEPGMGYRTPPGSANGVAVAAQPESIYMVTAGNHFNDRCCFDCERAPTRLCFVYVLDILAL